MTFLARLVTFSILICAYLELTKLEVQAIIVTLDAGLELLHNRPRLRGVVRALTAPAAAATPAPPS